MASRVRPGQPERAITPLDRILKTREVSVVGVVRSPRPHAHHPSVAPRSKNRAIKILMGFYGSLSIGNGGDKVVLISILPRLQLTAGECVVLVKII